MIIAKDAQIRYMVVGNGYLGVPPAAFLVELDEDVWRRAGRECRALGGPSQVICSDADAAYQRAGCRTLDYRICLTSPIVECL